MSYYNAVMKGAGKISFSGGLFFVCFFRRWRCLTKDAFRLRWCTS